MYTMVVKEVIAIDRNGEAEQFLDHGNKLVLGDSYNSDMCISCIKNVVMAWITINKLGWNS